MYSATGPVPMACPYIPLNASSALSRMPLLLDAVHHAIAFQVPDGGHRNSGDRHCPGQSHADTLTPVSTFSALGSSSRTACPSHPSLAHTIRLGGVPDVHARGSESGSSLGYPMPWMMAIFPSSYSRLNGAALGIDRQLVVDRQDFLLAHQDNSTCGHHSSADSCRELWYS